MPTHEELKAGLLEIFKIVEKLPEQLRLQVYERSILELLAATPSLSPGVVGIDQEKRVNPAGYMEANLDMPLSEVLAIIQDRIVGENTYFGVKAQKSPLDHWVYQEIIFETRPDVIVEIGNANGGGALSLAHLCDLLGGGRVIGVDLTHSDVPEDVKRHPRITFIDGDACESFEHVKNLISEEERVLVIEDSSHTYENTFNVLRAYSTLTKPGDYFIVEDSICYHGLSVGPKPGPYEAIETFVKENTDFEIDRSRESFLITWNPKGYLRRRKPQQ